jgi:hypothetical protein
MAKKKEGALSKIITFVAWLVGVIVSLSVGFALTEEVLKLPAWLGGTHQIGQFIAMTAGWIVVLTTLLGVFFTLVNKLKK